MMGGLIDPGALQIKRALWGNRLHGRCTLYAVTEVDGGQDWPGAGVVVNCLKGNPSTSSVQELSYDEVPYTWFWVPIGTVVATGYKLVYGVSPYQVERIPQIHSDE
jgi:hypothetical protein